MLFALKVVLSHRTPGWSYVMGIALPTKVRLQSSHMRDARNACATHTSAAQVNRAIINLSEDMIALIVIDLAS